MDIKKAGFRWTSHEEFCLARQVGSECERAQSDTWNVSELRLSNGNANGMLGFSQKSYVYGNESMKNIKMYRKWKDTQGPVFECLEYQPEELGFYLEENRNMWLSVVFSEGCHQDRCAWGALWAVGGAGEGQTRRLSEPRHQVWGANTWKEDVRTHVTGDQKDLGIGSSQ